MASPKYTGPGRMDRLSSDPKPHPSKGGGRSATQSAWNHDAVTIARPDSNPKGPIPGRIKTPKG
jgi:hypothetical protein